MARRIMPEIETALCTHCGECVANCPEGAAEMLASGQIVLDEVRCAYCGDCEDVCPTGAIRLPFAIVLPDPTSQQETQDGEA
jgi:ferredoxin